MVSRGVRQRITAGAGVQVVAAMLATCLAHAQPADATRAEEDLLQLIERVEAGSEDRGSSPDLIEPLVALGLIYQERGDHALAAAANERALELTRENYGLYSLEQVPVLQQSILNEDARGNPAGAWDLGQSLLQVVGRNPDDLRSVPVLREVADRRMDTLERYISGEYPAEIVLGCYYRRKDINFGTCVSGSKRYVSGEILLEAQELYGDAIAVILRNGDYSSDELRELETEILRSNYAYGNTLAPARRYELGKEHLERLNSYDLNVSDTPLTVAEGSILIADWELAYSNHKVALETYEQAYDRLAQEGTAAAIIEQIFAPAIPVVLPTFLPNPLVTEETPESTGHIDVSFEITRYGRARRIEILDTTNQAPEESVDRLIDLITGKRFRPRITAGEFARTSPVVLRYYLSD